MIDQNRICLGSTLQVNMKTNHVIFPKGDTDTVHSINFHHSIVTMKVSTRGYTFPLPSCTSYPSICNQ